jgi:putative ABC transport system permease protein
VRQTALGLTTASAVYVTPTQWHWVDQRVSLVVRGRGAPATLAPAVRAAIWSVDKDQAVVRVATMRELVEASVADRRFALVVFEAFGIAALVLAAIGLYGVMSYSTTSRSREFAIRLALGLHPGALARMIVIRALALVAAGLSIGVATTLLLRPLLRTLPFGGGGPDAPTCTAISLVLLAIALTASAVPALRAAAVDPVRALRHE